ncbi:MAG: class I tRNA ligase family protein, partial [Paeniglutamicibacter sp.]
WNVWHFFCLYTNAANHGAGYQAKLTYSAADPLDAYMLAATGDLVRETTAKLDAYDISDAAETIRAYMDTLTNWYVRRSRQRFFDEDTSAFDTLYTALETLTRVAAPLLPLASEEIWRGLTGGRSVHLADWPDAELFVRDDSLVAAMETTRKIASVGSSLRKAANLRVRLPLAGMTVAVPGAAALEGTFASIIADELNLRSLTLIDAADADASEYGISQRLVVNARAAGPRLGKNVQLAIKGAKSGDWSVDDAGTVTAGGLALEEHEYTLETVVEATEGEEKIAAAVLPGGGFLVLDTEVTPELAAEGTARDMIRAIQSARKDADLQVSDRIRTEITADAATVAALHANAELIKGETLSTGLVLVTGDDGMAPAVSVETVAEAEAADKEMGPTT